MTLGLYDLELNMFLAAPPTQSMGTKNLSKPKEEGHYSTH